MEKYNEDLYKIHLYFNEIEQEVRRKLGGTPESIIRKDIIDKFQEEEENILQNEDIVYSFDSYSYEKNSKKMELSINDLSNSISISYDEKRNMDHGVECTLLFTKRVIKENNEDLITNKYIHNYGNKDKSTPKTIEVLRSDGRHEDGFYDNLIEITYDDVLREYHTKTVSGENSSEELFTLDLNNQKVLRKYTIVRDGYLYENYGEALINDEEELPTSSMGQENVKGFVNSLDYSGLSFTEYEDQYKIFLNNFIETPTRKGR